ncbi:FmdB family zinc ribbon protein [Nesterenkonia marinintestina]|uniref:FmdB family zinc ribbon protein n=1 Tax=Nesterenkonia marinintestina TaxID=2979865 RepID=UPI0021C092CE|nr:zinc ribbon domain-containing protein [Nesterenkonia sp. GX14115]
MPIYEFSCRRCGRFDASRPMSSVPDALDCPTCAQDSPRVISAVGLSRAGSPAARTIDAAARTASEPPVVTGAPGRPRSAPVTTDPRHRRLPRP